MIVILHSTPKSRCELEEKFALKRCALVGGKHLHIKAGEETANRDGALGRIVNHIPSAQQIMKLN